MNLKPETFDRSDRSNIQYHTCPCCMRARMLRLVSPTSYSILYRFDIYPLPHAAVIASAAWTDKAPCRDHGHLWPYHPVTCDPIIPGHLRPYYPVTCDPIPLITLTPPAFHHTIVSFLLLYLNFPPAFHYTIVSILLLYLNFPPCVHCLHSTSSFKLPPLRSTKPLSPFYFFI